MFFQTLDRLREKPESTRRAAALGAALTITAVIVFVWLSVLITRFESVSVGAQDEKSRSDEAANTFFGGGAQEAYDTLIKERMQERFR